MQEYKRSTLEMVIHNVVSFILTLCILSIGSADAAQSIYKCKQLCDPTSNLIFSPDSFNIFSGELCTELTQDGGFIVDDSISYFDCTEAQTIARISGCCRTKTAQGAIEEIIKKQTNDGSGGGSKRSLQFFGFNIPINLGATNQNIADTIETVTEILDVDVDADVEDTAEDAINSVSNAIAGDTTNTANIVNDGHSEIGDTLTENAVLFNGIMNSVDTMAGDTNAGSGDSDAIATLISDSANAMDGTFTDTTIVTGEVENFVDIIADSTNIDSGNIDTIGDTSITQEMVLTGVEMLDTAAVSEMDINEAVGEAGEITNAIVDASIPQEMESMGTQMADTTIISEIAQVDIASNLNDINEAGEIMNAIGNASSPQEMGSIGAQMIDSTIISEIAHVDIASNLTDISDAVGDAIGDTFIPQVLTNMTVGADPCKDCNSMELCYQADFCKLRDNATGVWLLQYCNIGPSCEECFPDSPCYRGNSTPTTALPTVSTTASPTTASPTVSPMSSPTAGLSTLSPTAFPTASPTASPTTAKMKSAMPTKNTDTDDNVAVNTNDAITNLWFAIRGGGT